MELKSSLIWSTNFSSWLQYSLCGYAQYNLFSPTLSSCSIKSRPHFIFHWILLIILRSRIESMSSSQSSPTSVYKSAWTASRYAPSRRWMYNGGCSPWYTISAKSTPLGHSIDPKPIKPSVQLPLNTRRPVFNDLWLVKAHSKTGFSTVSLGV